jgi:hypothetical protein
MIPPRGGGFKITTIHFGFARYTKENDRNTRSGKSLVSKIARWGLELLWPQAHAKL